MRIFWTAHGSTNAYATEEFQTRRVASGLQAVSDDHSLVVMEDPQQVAMDVVGRCAEAVLPAPRCNGRG